MRGIDFFPQHPAWAQEYDVHIRRWMRHNERNFDILPVTVAEFDSVYVSLIPAFENWRRERGETGDELWTGIKELDVSSLPEKTFDRPKLRPFKLQYDTVEEVRMRFKGTCILIRGNPFYVSDVRQSKRKFHLLIEDIADKKGTICLDDISDFRSPPPGYIQVDTEHAYMTRIPARVNQQGLNNLNTVLRRVSSGKVMSFSTKNLVQAVESKGKVTPWNEHFLSLVSNNILPEFRLSDEVAVFTKKGASKIYIGYKGRMFGTLSGHTVSAYDEDDLIQPWVKKHFDKVNLEIMT